MSHYSETERRNAVRFQNVISHAPIGAALIDESGRFLSANAALLELVGAPSEEAFLAQNIRQSGSYQNDSIRKLVDDLRDGAPETAIDAKWTSNWDKSVSVRIFITRLNTADGRVAYQVFYLDRAGPMATQDDETVLEPTINAANNEFYLIDQTTLKFLHVSQRGIEQLGYSLDELKDMTSLDINPELTPESLERQLEPLLLGETQTIVRQLQQRRKDGSVYLAETGTQCTLFMGEPAFLIIAQDITYNMEMAAALTQAQLFLNAAPDPTIIVNEDGIIQFASARTGALLGYEREELIGLNVDDLVPDMLRATHKRQRMDFAGERDARRMGNSRVVEALRKDGSVVPVEVALSPIQTKDGLLVAAAHRDVTQRIEIEKALKDARDQAENATRAKSAFLAAASHDLRQPLQSMSAYLWTLQQMLDTPEQKRLADSIETSLDGVSDLLNALLDISKLDGGGITPEIQVFDIQSLCEPILINFQPVAEEKGLELICEGEPHLVRSDPALLLRILENLVGNALRYTAKGKVQLACRRSGSLLDITVSDTGVGIPADKLDAVFEEYFQLDNKAREKTKGLGFGLSIVRRIANLLDHPISVASELGIGSQFTISVTLAEGADLASSTEVAHDSIRTVGPPPARVLLVDDDPAVLDSTTMMLELMGCQVFAASDGDVAVDLLKSGVQPDVLVTDYRLPRCFGTELIERARDELGVNLPAVLITGDMSGVATRVENLGDVVLLQKPTKPNDLIDAIEDHVTNRHTTVL